MLILFGLHEPLIDDMPLLLAPGGTAYKDKFIGRSGYFAAISEATVAPVLWPMMLALEMPILSMNSAMASANRSMEYLLGGVSDFAKPGISGA